MSVEKQPAKVDWMIHYVLDQHGPGNICNGHTHGMENYGHLNFQIVLPIVQEQMALLLNTICFKVREGMKFEPGEYPMENEVYSCAFRLQKVRETGRDVLRIILCDPNFRFPEDPDCQEPYQYQTATSFAED